VLGAIAVFSAGLSGPAHAAPAPVQRVSMVHFTFSPANVVIRRGTVVRWTYDEHASDPEPNCESPYAQESVSVPAGYYYGGVGPLCPGHSTTAVDTGPGGKTSWDSGVHRADGFPFAMKFTKPGTYHYYCTVHGGQYPNNPVTHMDGVIVVR
jgi:plastocyanin